MKHQSFLTLKPFPPSDYRTNDSVWKAWLDGETFSIIGSDQAVSIENIKEIKKYYMAIIFYFNGLSNNFIMEI